MNHTKLVLVAAAIATLLPAGNRLQFKIAIVYLLASCVWVDAQLYEWSCSPLDVNSNHYTLPDLGYGDDENVASIGDHLAGSDDVDIYPVPSTLNCSGTVTALQFCYAGLVPVSDTGAHQYGVDHVVFTLLILEQTNLAFRILNLIEVRHIPTVLNCTDISNYRYCCDIFHLDTADYFSLLEQNFAFGMVRTPSTTLVEYDIDAFPSLRVMERYRFHVAILGVVQVGNIFILDNSTRIDESLALFEFIISK